MCQSDWRIVFFKVHISKQHQPNFRQQKAFFRQAGPFNSRRPAFKSDFAPMNIFENSQTFQKVVHQIWLPFRVLSLGMKFIPKTHTIMWNFVRTVIFFFFDEVKWGFPTTSGIKEYHIKRKKLLELLFEINFSD